MQESASTSARRTANCAAAEAVSTAYPLHVFGRSGQTIAIVGDAAVCTLPFDADACAHRILTSPTEAQAAPLLLAADVGTPPFLWCARVRHSLSSTASRHCVLVTHAQSGVAASALVNSAGDSEAGSGNPWTALEGNAALWSPATKTATATVHVQLMSVPLIAPGISSSLHDTPTAATRVATRVVLADSPAGLMAAIRRLFARLLGPTAADVAETEVCWPACLPVPVNVHTRDDARRCAEHVALLLPRRGLLRHSAAIDEWVTWHDLERAHAARGTTTFRTGEAWERHLVTSPHTELAAAAAPSLQDAETLLTSGPYDYYHYRVDGFRDDGWGCAYRSLQTVLSWFQHAGLMRAAMPSIRRIQEILYEVDPDKTGKKAFVGSSEWIGSFEVMLVLQNHLPGLECTIKRLESGRDLDTDAGVQMLLSEHFRGPDAAPVMIGGSSYAHTILGLHVNVQTMEAEYLVLDPHYSANPTQLKAAIKKGYVGWKKASEFFEAGSWYNLCIPRTDTYDPR